MSNSFKRITLTSRHYPALDGLRGIAVLLVMLHHFVRSYDSIGAFHDFALQITEFMWTGVDLFFVLSGFLITGILLETLQSANYFRTFYLRRILRIFPLYYGVLAAAFVVMPLLHLSPSAESSANLIYFLTFTSNIHFAFAGWTMHPFDVYWSLAVEEQFYLFWPVTLLFVPESYRKVLIIAGLVAGIVLRYVAVHTGASSIFIFTMLPTHADGLLVGALIAVLAREKNGLPVLGNKLPVILTILIASFLISSTFHLFGLRLYYDAWNTKGAMFYYLIIAVAYGCLLYISIADRNPIQKIFGNRILIKAGTFSYCLYLIHQAVAHLLNWTYAMTGFEQTLRTAQPFYRDIAHLAPLFLISFGLAYLSWRFIERPILSLKRYVPYRENRPDFEVH